MGTRTKPALSTFFLLLLLTGAGTASAEIRSGDDVVVGREEAVQEDLYVFGGEIRIDGAVEGDVVAAGGTVEIRGPVQGDVISFSGTTRISAPVAGSVRIAGGDVLISAPVGDDVVFVGGDLDVAKEARVGRDVLIGAGRATLNAPVGGDVRAGSGELTLTAPVEGDVRARTSKLTVTDTAAVGGVLATRSQTTQISPDADIGQLQAEKVEPPPVGVQVLGFLYAWARAFIGLTVLGLIIALLSPRFARAVPDTLRTAPWKSLGIGAAILFGVPLVAAVIFVVGLLLGGWWIALLLLVALAALMLLAFPAIGYTLGQTVIAATRSERGRRVLALLLGVAVLTLAAAIPVLGALVALATVLFGMGALLLTGFRLRRTPAPA